MIQKESVQMSVVLKWLLVQESLFKLVQTYVIIIFINKNIITCQCKYINKPRHFSAFTEVRKHLASL